MDPFNSIIGDSVKLKLVIENARKIATTGATALVSGETGTGKEVLVRAIHRASDRKDRPLVSVNCAALPETIVESELFGHEKGSFTGATDRHEGLVPCADGGTLFLDEVDSLSLSVQSKLLRFLESGEYRKVGAVRNQKVNVRLIAATNSNLKEKTRRGEFREDLYFRLDVLRLELPSLRERADDIDLLVRYFLTDIAQIHGEKKPEIGPGVLEILRAYLWPGNIRELRNFCERMTILHSGGEISLQDVPAEYFNESTREPRTKTQTLNLPEAGLNLDDIEIQLIHQALKRTSGNRTQSARLLGISRYALNYRMQKHAIEDDATTH